MVVIAKWQEMTWFGIVQWPTSLWSHYVKWQQHKDCKLFIEQVHNMMNMEQHLKKVKLNYSVFKKDDGPRWIPGEVVGLSHIQWTLSCCYMIKKMKYVMVQQCFLEMCAMILVKENKRVREPVLLAPYVEYTQWGHDKKLLMLINHDITNTKNTYQNILSNHYIDSWNVNFSSIQRVPLQIQTVSLDLENITVLALMNCLLLQKINLPYFICFPSNIPL